MMKDTVKMMTKDEDCEFLRKTWLNCLVRVAEAHGAKVPTNFIELFANIKALNTDMNGQREEVAFSHPK